MGFFSVLTDISHNQNNFKKWEKDEVDKDAKRKALYERGVGKERLSDAKKRGDVIIDVITQMDQHSENMAEDIESVSDTTAGIIQTAGLWGGPVAGMLVYGRQWAKVEKAQDKYIKEHDIKSLYNQLYDNLGKQKLEIINKKYNGDFDAYWKAKEAGIEKMPVIWSDKYILKQKAFDKYAPYIGDTSLLDKIKVHIAPFEKLSAPLKHAKKYAIATAITVPIVSLVGSILASTKLQLDGSRIARWQSREKLKDAKNFVIYTPEQIATAKENLKRKPQPKLTFWQKLTGKDKTDKNNSGFFKNWYGFIKDRRAYNAWKAQDSDDSKIVTRNLSKEEQQQAKLDKELIQRITKKINNKAEEYSENMETAAGTILGSSLLGGAALGWASSAILNKLKLGDRMAKNILSNNTTPELAKTILDEQKNAKTFWSKLKNTASSIEKIGDYFENISGKSKEDMLKHAKDGASAVMQNTKKISFMKRAMTYLAATPISRNFAVGVAASALTTVATVFLTLKLQKNAARAGRYIAREEFRDNPQEFLSYTDEEMEQVKDVQGKQKTTGKKFKEWISFVPVAVKQMFRYEKYKKTELKAQQDLKEELSKIKVSDKQLKDAKNLQNKLYNTFEKVDEYSQVYSENMEAANEMAQPFIQLSGIALTVSPLIVIATGVAKGKISVMKLGDWATTLLTKFSGIMKTKMFKTHISQATDNFVKAIEKTELPKDIQTDNAIQIFKQIVARKGSLNLNAKELQQLKQMKDMNLLSLLQENPDAIPMGKQLARIIEEKDPNKKMKLLQRHAKTFMTLNEIPKYIQNTVMGIVSKTDAKSTGIAFEKLDKLAKLKVSDVINVETGEYDLTKFLNMQNLSKTLKSMPLIDKINSENAFNMFKAIITAIPEKTIKDKFAPLATKKIIGNVKLGAIDKQYLLRMLDKVEKSAKNCPQAEISQQLNKILKAVLNNPEKFMYMTKHNPEKFAKLFGSDTLNETLLAAGISWGVLTTVLTYLLESYFASMQKDAGRLGVMKAIDKLEDYRYYADAIPTDDKINTQTSKLTNTKFPTTNWLSKKSA